MLNHPKGLPQLGSSGHTADAAAGKEQEAFLVPQKLGGLPFSRGVVDFTEVSHL